MTLILTFFVILGHSLLPAKYEITPKLILYNTSGYWTTYNGHMWFLLPYVILSALAPGLFDYVKKYKASVVIGVALIVHIFTCRLAGLYGESFLYENRWAYTPIVVLNLMFNFLLGAMCARENFFHKMRNKCYNSLKYRILSVLSVLLLLLFQCSFGYNFFYEFCLITCLLILRRPKWLEFFMCKLGDHSMNMWMIHGWFCNLLFREFIYSFRYPVIIYIVTLVLSFATSMLVNFVVRYLFTIYSAIKVKIHAY